MHRKIRLVRAIDKIKLNKIGNKDHKAMKSRKDMGRMLPPDAPARKKRDKSKRIIPSPERLDCELVPGTPMTPPPPLVPLWKKSKVSQESFHFTVGDVNIELIDNMVSDNESRESMPILQAISPSSRIVVLSPVETSSNQSMSFQKTSAQECQDPMNESQATDFNSSCENEDVPNFEELQLLENLDQNNGSDVEDEEQENIAACGPAHGAADFSADFPESADPSDVERILDMDRCDDLYLESVTDPEVSHFDWCEDRKVFQGVKEVFTGVSGPTFKLEDDLSPLALLEKIWDSDILNLIVEQTNLYGEQLLRKPSLKSNSRMKRWAPITATDIWLFFGVLILQGMDPRSTESDFWYSKLEVLEMPKFKNVMSFNKYILIKRSLHFVNNKTLPRGCDKAAKIKPIVDHLNKKFSELYLPGQEIALDESLLLWKGKLRFAQKISTKAAGIGVKTYELCDSKTGYLWSFRLYTGKDSTAPAAENTVNERPDEPNSKTSAIVFDLVRPLLNKGHVLYMDNFYNSPLLSRLLKLQLTDTVGTLRINRKFVPDSLKHIKKTDMRIGEIAFSNTKDITVVLWRDSNLVALISTLHPVQIGAKDKHGIFKNKPKVVLDYNNFMGGVDKKDQLLSAFPMERCRNHVWYKKLFRRLLNVSIINSWIIWNTKKNMSHRAFREQLVQNILAKHQPITKVVNMNLNPKGRPRLVGGHYIVKGTSKRAVCRFCTMRGIVDKRTSKACDVCKIPLCLEPCFKEYHTTK